MVCDLGTPGCTGQMEPGHSCLAVKRPGKDCACLRECVYAGTHAQRMDGGRGEIAGKGTVRGVLSVWR